MQVSPTREEFLRLSGQGNVIPVRADLLADLETPVSAYAKLRGNGPAFLLESVEGGEHVSRYSFIGCNPRKILSARPGAADPLAELQKELAGYRPVSVPGLPPFTGGAGGYPGHEVIHNGEPTGPPPAPRQLRVAPMWVLPFRPAPAFCRRPHTHAPLRQPPPR